MNVKTQLYNYCKSFLLQKINALNETISDLQQSANNETKSSVGDKYETGRAMLQLEIEKNAKQLNAWKLQLLELEKLKADQQSDKVEAGALICCNNANYYIAVACGKIGIENQIYYAISVEAPIAQQMLGKAAGDTFLFNENEFLIKAIF